MNHYFEMLLITGFVLIGIVAAICTAKDALKKGDKKTALIGASTQLLIMGIPVISIIKAIS